MILFIYTLFHFLYYQFFNDSRNFIQNRLCFCKNIKSDDTKVNHVCNVITYITFSVMKALRLRIVNLIFRVRVAQALYTYSVARAMHACDCDCDLARRRVRATIGFPLLRFPSKRASFRPSCAIRRYFEFKGLFTFPHSRATINDLKFGFF